MIYLVTGGSGSGKSEYAEALACRLDSGPKYYIATMSAQDSESQKRILRHRQMRRQKCFETLECYTDLACLKLPEKRVILLDCLSNLAANEMFQAGRSKTEAIETILAGVRALAANCLSLILVTNEIFSDGYPYSEMTREYLACLGGLNRALSTMADDLTEVVFSLPVKIKGVIE